MNKWTRAFYQPNLPLKGRERVTASPEHLKLSLEAAKEGMILLKNDHDLLPLQAGSKLALFGKGVFDYVKGGGGSGDVTVEYVRSLYDGLKEQDVTIYEPLCDFYRQNVEAEYQNGALPGMIAEPALPDELAVSARENADIAILCISRFSGEGWDRSSVEYEGEYNPWPNETSQPKMAGKIFPDGDFYLTAEEKKLLAQVTERFDKVAVVLNVGGMMDTTWLKNTKISSVLLVWQAGMEGGTAMAELLCGKGNPSGKLPDTFAEKLEDYPSVEHFHDSPHYVTYEEDIYVGYRYFETIPNAQEKVVYPFGFGLSYTSFALSGGSVSEQKGVFTAQVTVKNTGSYAGKEVVQVYAQPPQGKLGKPSRVLVAFQKTKLLQPGESQTITLTFDRYAMASYDDLGKVQKSAWLLEQGAYRFHIGTSVRDTVAAEFVYVLENDVILEQLQPKLVPTSLPKRMLSDGSFEPLPTTAPHDMNQSVIPKMTPGTEEGLTPYTPSRERHMVFDEVRRDIRPLMEVYEGKLSLDQFMEQLSDSDLLHLCGGQPNTGVANTYGFGNLKEYGIPNVQTCDGPAGLRIQPECGVCTTAFPCSTLLASTWNPDIIEQVGVAGAEEVKENNLSVWLTPAVCIHRNPLCGRNFEYYSEDPVLSGKLASAMIRGIQSKGISAAPKHFAANNKETNRKHSDSRLSERALREIYIKQFEIIVKESDPWTIMSAYNVINGQRASESGELLTDILRNEWGFTGLVMSDWWNRAEHYKEIKAGNDVKMATGFPERVEEALKLDAVTREEIKICAKRVLELILKLD